MMKKHHKQWGATSGSPVVCERIFTTIDMKENIIERDVWGDERYFDKIGRILGTGGSDATTRRNGAWKADRCKKGVRDYRYDKTALVCTHKEGDKHGENCRCL